MQPTVDMKTVMSQLMEVVSKYPAASPDVSQNTVTPSHLMQTIYIVFWN